MSRYNSIKVTKDLSIFKNIKGNRVLKPSHVENLAEVLKGNPDMLAYNPILVNDKLEVIDGQHRLEAAKQTGAPVYYIISKKLGLKDVQALNSNTKAWTPLDYAISYNELGNINYRIYLDFASLYPFNHDVLRYILSEGKAKGDTFKNGDFQVRNAREASRFFDMLMDFKPLYKRFNHRSFAFGFQKIMQNEQYDHQRMIKKMSKQAFRMGDHTDPMEYVRELENIYNSGVSQSDKVRLF